MDPFAWHRFRRRSRAAGGLLITTHQPGRLPTLWQCRTSAALLAAIAAELLGVENEMIRDLAETLFQKQRGNLRDALRKWYDLLAEKREIVAKRNGVVEDPSCSHGPDPAPPSKTRCVGLSAAADCFGCESRHTGATSLRLGKYVRYRVASRVRSVIPSV
jgi:hypothetical protein